MYRHILYMVAVLLLTVDCSSVGEALIFDKGVIDGIPLKPDMGVDAPADSSADQTRPDGQPPRDFVVLSDAVKDSAGCEPANDTCGAAKILSWSGSKIVESGNTKCATDDVAFAAKGCNGALADGTAGRDVFYEIVLPAGTFEVRLTSPQWDSALYVLGSCGTNDCIGASDEINTGVEEFVPLSFSSSTKVLIGVDAYDSTQAGSYTLTISGSALPSDSGPDTMPDAMPDATPDAAPDSGPDTSGTGDIVITEIMINPSAVGDTAGEWIELYNAGTTAVNLNGWRIEDQPGSSQNKHTIASDVMVPANGYVVIGRSTASSTNGGVSVAYAYANTFPLANAADEVFLYDATGGLVDQVEYVDTWPLPTGASISLKSVGLDNNDPANWCEETAVWSGSAGDKGTPGAPSGC